MTPITDLEKQNKKIHEITDKPITSESEVTNTPAAWLFVSVVLLFATIMLLYVTGLLEQMVLLVLHYNELV